MRSFALLSLMTTAVTALGINCRGNANCVGTPQCRLSDIILQVSQLDQSQTFAPGEHIGGCGIPGGHIYAFTQNWNEDITAGQALGMLQGLAEHGCGQCGSIPFKDNNVAYGELTVNWGAITLSQDTDLDVFSSNPVLDIPTLECKVVIITGGRLDILLNNAGVMMLPEDLTNDGHGIQTVSTSPDVRIVFVFGSSAGEMMAPKDPDQTVRLKNPLPHLSTTARNGISKVANIYSAASLVAGYTSIKVISIHPEIANTNLATPFKNSSLNMGKIVAVFNSIVTVHPDKGCLNRVCAATNPEAESGVFYHPVGVKGKASKMTRDKVTRDQFWNWTQEEIKQLPIDINDA